MPMCVVSLQPGRKKNGRAHLPSHILSVQRQKEVVKNLYAECMALEELLEEAVNTLGPDARDILTQVR